MTYHFSKPAILAAPPKARDTIHELRKTLERRRQARRAAIAIGALAVALAIGAGILGKLDNVPGAVVLGMAAAAALIVANVAALEA